MRRFRRVITATSAALVTGAVWFWCAPLPAELREPLAGTLTLLDSRGREIAELPSATARVQLPRRLDQMGKWLPAVTVALEDRRFYQHHGIDISAVFGAAIRNVKSGRVISGGSTITQQLVKLARGRQRRSWLAKCYETALAFKLERHWSKEQILTAYLNRSSYGNRRLGPEAAARAYFGKSATDLTLAESIFLAGIPQAPTRFNPWHHAEQANARSARSLNRLRDLGMISSEQQLAFAAVPPVAQHFAPPHLAPHFVDAVVAQNRGARGVLQTALDFNLQQLADRTLKSHLAAINRTDITQAAVVIVENQSGAVRALVGSSDYALSQINGATQARSCGSTLKPFVYLAALDRRLITAATLLPDTPDAIRDEYADYDPQNYNHHYLGPVRAREALACSLNVPAVYVLSQLGARPAFHELRKWGFAFPRELSDYGAGFILGNAEVRLVDLAASYASLARGGVAMPAKFLATEHHEMTRLASPEATAIITDILCDNEARQKTFGAHSPLAFEQRVAVKTGTSSGFRDAWTVGFTKQHTVAVWTGNFDGAPMRDTLAVRSASPLWANIVRQLLAQDDPVDPPPQSDALVRKTICADTGMLPSTFSGATRDELFLRGTEPQTSGASFFTSNGKPLLPAQYAAWCTSADNIRAAQVRPALAITNPRGNARYEIDPALPPSQQMIELTASVGDNVRWFVGETEQSPQRDGRYRWPLTAGMWNVRAVGSAGQAETSFTVE